MDAMSWCKELMQAILNKLKKDFPAITFSGSSTFLWSSVEQTVFYKESFGNEQIAVWSLLHELGHGLLGHMDYDSDFTLLQMEMLAWQEAKQLAEHYGYALSDGHIQDCLDTYRDWLYQRSTCPTCTNGSLQTNKTTYICFNCDTTWRVSHSRMCRQYRRKQKEASV